MHTIIAYNDVDYANNWLGRLVLCKGGVRSISPIVRLTFWPLPLLLFRGSYVVFTVNTHSSTAVVL